MVIYEDEYDLDRYTILLVILGDKLCPYVHELDVGKSDPVGLEYPFDPADMFWFLDP